MEEAQVIVIPKAPRVAPGRMILLTLLVTLPFLALLVMEQGRVIDSQRLLIQQLVGDSLELNNMKIRDLNSNRQPGPANKSTPQSPAAGPQSHSSQPGAAAKPQKRNDQKQTPAEPQLPPVKNRDMSRLKSV